MSSIRYCCLPRLQPRKEIASKGGEGRGASGKKRRGLHNKSFQQKVGRRHMFKKSDVLILGAGFVSFLFSVSLWFGFFGAANKEAGLFVGLWVPSILSAGMYFKTRVGAR